MQRVTTEVLQAKVERVNAKLGHGRNYDNPIRLYSAYGETAVVQSVGSGQEHLSGFGTKKECAIFLDGMLAGARQVVAN